MTVEGGVRVLAGVMVLASLGLGLWVSQWWFILTGFVGVNLIQSAFTGFCPPEKLLRKMGLKPGGCCSALKTDA
jgi:hypothetical protein